MNLNTSAAPRKIISHGWGEIQLDDGRRFKDVKLWPGGARKWDWNETGTRHQPGIQFADVEECLVPDLEVIILSRGRLNRLNVPTSLVKQLESRGLSVHVLPTGKAIERYNELAETVPTAALIHSTC